MICEDCGESIGANDTPVYADEGVYHMGCEFEEVYERL